MILQYAQDGETSSSSGEKGGIFGADGFEYTLLRGGTTGCTGGFDICRVSCVELGLKTSMVFFIADLIGCFGCRPGVVKVLRW